MIAGMESESSSRVTVTFQSEVAARAAGTPILARGRAPASHESGDDRDAGSQDKSRGRLPKEPASMLSR